MVRARPLALGPTCTALAAADPVPATKSLSAARAVGAASVTRAAAIAAAATLRPYRRVTVVTPSLFDAAAPCPLRGARSGAEEGGCGVAALDDVLHALLDHRRHLRVGEDV